MGYKWTKQNERNARTLARLVEAEQKHGLDRIIKAVEVETIDAGIPAFKSKRGSSGVRDNIRKSLASALRNEHGWVEKSRILVEAGLDRLEAETTAGRPPEAQSLTAALKANTMVVALPEREGFSMIEALNEVWTALEVSDLPYDKRQEYLALIARHEAMRVLRKRGTFSIGRESVA